MKRPIRIDGDVAYVPLTKGYEAVIDAADAPLVDGRNWSALVVLKKDRTPAKVYAKTDILMDGRHVTVLLHRLLMGMKDGLTVDHRDGDGLNCRRLNMRDATRRQNSQNRKLSSDSTSGLKGASWDRTHGKWQSCIRVDGRKKHLGYFADRAEAAATYAKASAQYHGEFGRTE